MNIIQEIRDEIKIASVEPSNRDLNLLALIFVAFPGVIGLLALWRGSPRGWYWIAAGLILGSARAIPPLFRTIYKVWIAIAVIIGYFVSRILLTIIFFLIITPMGFIMRLKGKDPMDRKLDPVASTYWIPKEETTDTSIKRYEKQF